MFDRQWIISEESDKGAGIDSLLRNRGIDNPADFLRGNSGDYDNPFGIKDIDVAVERILSAQENGERITVFGDYDCDGITSTTILYHFLRTVLEADVTYYIPDRFTEGYGMSVTAVDRLCESGTSLIITVDNGIAAKEAVRRAADLGISVIVTDHHQCPQELPECEAVIDPHMDGSGFIYRDLCGAGVALIVITAISDTLGMDREEIRHYFSLAAIGTIGDCVPLTGLNRFIVREGFKVLQGDLDIWPGLKCLMEKSDIDTGKLTYGNIAFKLVPKLNAAGRLGSADRAVSLLLEEDPKVCVKCSEILIEENNKRKETEQTIYEDAISGGKIYTSDDDSCVIAVGNDWHHGVIGIVASRLCEKYNKPAFVFTFDHTEDSEEILKGSARSVKGFHLFNAISSVSDCTVKFGGHEMAAGLSIKKSMLERFIEGLNEFDKKIKALGAPPPQLLIDLILRPSEITVPFIESLSALEPFGEGNPQPVFATSGLRVMKTFRMGDGGKHLRVTFSSDEGTVEGLMFNNGKLEETVKRMNLCSIAYTLSLNTWNNATKPQIVITDIHDFDISVEKSISCCYNKGYISYESFGLCRSFLVEIYKIITGLGEHFTFGDIANAKNVLVSKGIPCSWYMLRKSVEVFSELGIIQRPSKTEFMLNKSAGKADLQSSAVYKSVMF